MSCSQIISGTPAYLAPSAQDQRRVGYTPALINGNTVIAAPYISASSEVNLSVSVIGAALAAAPATPVPVVTIQPGVSFTVAGLADHVGSIWSYSVVG